MGEKLSRWGDLNLELTVSWLQTHIDPLLTHPSVLLFGTL